MTKKSRSKFIFKAPFNSLSLGQVSYCLTKEMFKLGLDVSIFPISDKVDISSFEVDKDFSNWLKDKALNRYSGIGRDTKTIQLWHIRSSDSSPTPNSYLYTFHEIMGSTSVERSICELHNEVIFSSSFSRDMFLKNGTKNSHFVPVGFDESIKKTSKTYFNDCVHFILVGKWEKRKNTELIIKTWIELFGNDKKYRLTCLVDNPFFGKDIMQKLVENVLGGKKYFNVTFLPRLQKNAEVNDLYNSADIDLSGLSSGEGWNLPSFNSTCLGKWSCVSNCSSHKDWATNENSILVEPDGFAEPYDQAFFVKGEEFNQGLIYKISKASIEKAMTDAVKKAKTPNENGVLLKSKFSYENMLNSILDICEV